MWTRNEIKTDAKNLLRTRYWIAFAVSLVAGILTGSGGVGGGRFNYSYSFGQGDLDQFMKNWQSGDLEEAFRGMADLLATRWSAILVIALVVGALFFVLGIAYQLFVAAPVEVGSARWYSRNRESMEKAPSFTTLFSLFRRGAFLRTVGAMFWKNLWLFLWGIPAFLLWIAAVAVFILSLFQASAAGLLDPSYDWSRVDDLVLVSGFLAGFGLMILAAVAGLLPFFRSYAYRMTPWILADNPGIGHRRALKLSIGMTRGHKFAIFVLDLSFIGWYILGFLACCVGLLFVAPYVQATMAELYARLRQEAVGEGLTTMEELGFVRQPTEPVPADATPYGTV